MSRKEVILVVVFSILIISIVGCQNKNSNSKKGTTSKTSSINKETNSKGKEILKETTKNESTEKPTASIEIKDPKNESTTTVVETQPETTNPVPTQPQTPAPTQPQTQAQTEAPKSVQPETQAPTPAPTQPQTPEPTQPPTQPQTEAPREIPVEFYEMPVSDGDWLSTSTFLANADCVLEDYSFMGSPIYSRISYYSIAITKPWKYTTDEMIVDSSGKYISEDRYVQLIKKDTGELEGVNIEQKIREYYRENAK